MGTVTYSDNEVTAYLREHFISVQFNTEERPDVMDQFDVVWTPTILVQDSSAREYRRMQGFLDPKRFIGELALGRVQAALRRKDFEAAQILAREAVERTADDPERNPEALYWQAVVAYKSSHDGSRLVEGWNQLLDQFPESEWAKRAEFIRK